MNFNIGNNSPMTPCERCDHVDHLLNLDGWLLCGRCYKRCLERQDAYELGQLRKLLAERDAPGIDYASEV